MQLRSKQQEIASLELELGRMQAREVVNESEVTRAQNRIKQLEDEVEQQRADLVASGGYKREASIAVAELAVLEEQLEETRRQNQSQKDKIQDLEQEVGKLAGELPRQEPVEQQVTTVAAGPLIEICLLYTSPSPRDS